MHDDAVGQHGIWTRHPLAGVFLLALAGSFLLTILVTFPMVGPWWLFTPPLLGLVGAIIAASTVVLAVVRPRIPEKNRILAAFAGVTGAFVPPVLGIAWFLVAVTFFGGH